MVQNRTSFIIFLLWSTGKRDETTFCVFCNSGIWESINNIPICDASFLQITLRLQFDGLAKLGFS